MAPVRALIVDDHADVRFLIRAIMADADAGVEVVAEADGLDAALVAIDRHAPDVAVVDARMPRTDGFAAAPLLQARRPEIALVLCTGWVDAEVERRAAAAGFAAVVPKDRFDDLPAVVERVGRRAN